VISQLCFYDFPGFSQQPNRGQKSFTKAKQKKSLVEETHISKRVRKALAFGSLSVTSATVN
jgi:hypothetical protein